MWPKPTSAAFAPTTISADAPNPTHPSTPGVTSVAATTPARSGRGASSRSPISVAGSATRLQASPAANTAHASTATVMDTAAERSSRARASRSPSVSGRVSQRSRISQVTGGAVTTTDLRASRTRR